MGEGEARKGHDSHLVTMTTWNDMRKSWCIKVVRVHGVAREHKLATVTTWNVRAIMGHVSCVGREESKHNLVTMTTWNVRTIMGQV